LTTFEIDVAATKRMALIVQRNRARGAWGRVTDTAANGGPWRSVDWASPWIGCADSAHSTAAYCGVMAERPDITVLWARDVAESSQPLAEIAAMVGALVPDAADDDKFVPHPRPADLITEGLAVLGRIWPEARAETDELVRQIILADVLGLRSCSLLPTFGAVFVGEKTLPDLPAAVEMLLHETGHHSLFMRTAFAKHVENGTEITAHPLRSDPRPLEGAVHALFALTRMVDGLRRWRDIGDPDIGHVQKRLERNLDKLDPCSKPRPGGPRLGTSCSRTPNGSRGGPPNRARWDRP
jgi:hypothetical protein